MKPSRKKKAVLGLDWLDGLTVQQADRTWATDMFGGLYRAATREFRQPATGFELLESPVNGSKFAVKREGRAVLFDLDLHAHCIRVAHLGFTRGELKAWNVEAETVILAPRLATSRAELVSSRDYLANALAMIGARAVLAPAGIVAAKLFGDAFNKNAIDASIGRFRGERP